MNSFKGKITAFRAYNRVLSAREIHNIFMRFWLTRRERARLRHQRMTTGKHGMRRPR